jgi:hypothetical protein
VPSRRVLQGALEGFLGTYTSRNSDFDGYWLFGFLVSDFPLLEIDLLGASGGDTRTPEGRACELARARFLQQVERAALSLDVVEAAQLVIQLEGPAEALVNGRVRSAFEVQVAVTAVSTWGRVFRAERRLFVAPHDPGREQRSARVT